MKIINQTLWLLPFLCFVGGYQLLDQIASPKIIPTPQLVGRNITEALKITSELKLNLRIISEQIDPDLQENTILSQKPSEASIKENQTIFIVICKKPTPPSAPNLIGLASEQINDLLKNSSLKSHTYDLPNLAPAGTCFAQTPPAGQPVSQPKIIAYLSSKNQNLVIMPNLVTQTVADCQSFLDQHEICLQIKPAPNLNLPANTILAQKPAAGSMIDLNTLKQVELLVSH